MNKFFSLEGNQRRRPSVVLARLEQVESSDLSRAEDELQFSAVDFNWAMSISSDAQPLTVFHDAPLSMIRMKRNVGRRLGWHQPSSKSEEYDWWTLMQFPPKGGLIANVFLSLFGAPYQLPVQLEHAPREVVNKIAKLASLDTVQDAGVSDIDAKIDLKKRVFAVGVYDVGQGNCNAVLDDSYTPLLYFDFGGGGKSTFPKAVKRFCLLNGPTVVLSHWDLDHWSAAARDVRIQHQTWIAPRQRFGPMHASMASHIRASGTLLIWPSKRKTLRVGQIEILKCIGRPRNDDGLAMLVYPEQSHFSPILLTGDAAYKFIPGALSSTLAGLVVPHHGAKTPSSVVPDPTANGFERIVYSYGSGNRWGHPIATTISDHVVGGWKSRLDTASTAVRRPAHIAIGWQRLACGNPMPPLHSCDLKIVQV